MLGLKKHLELFPERIRGALLAYRDWEGISEIRLRRNLPLSLTHFNGNLFLDEDGKPSVIERALRAEETELRALVCAFCQGDVYRYFETLKDGFLVDEDGYRLGLCPEKVPVSSFLPERFEGANLRIPRMAHGAAKGLLEHFKSSPLSSTLILSSPGAGKTTLLRDLAIRLSRGDGHREALRVAVVDERREIIPSVFLPEAGLCDVLSGYGKGEGISIATRLFSPQVILCDEIGGKDDADAILSACNAGCLLFASAHASSLEEAKNRTFIRSLLEAGVFSYVALLERIPDMRFRSRLTVREAL